MPTSPRSTASWQKQQDISRWINITGVPILVIMAVFGLIMLNTVSQRSFMPITAMQADKVGQASAFLERAGFNDPVYLGVLPATEGEYPTFSATAIGGEPINLLIRTTPNGGWEIQPDGIFHSVNSADDFARVADEAVSDWELVQSGVRSDIKPSKNGEFGEYESREYNYNLLKKYNPPESYWTPQGDEANGWPRK